MAGTGPNNDVLLWGADGRVLANVRRATAFYWHYGMPCRSGIWNCLYEMYHECVRVCISSPGITSDYLWVFFSENEMHKRVSAVKGSTAPPQI